MTINEYLDLVKDALEDLDELDGIGVIVDKQQDVDAEKKEYLSKSKGYAVIIGEVSNRETGKHHRTAEITLKYGVTIYSPKVVKSPAKTGAQLRDTIISFLHGWLAGVHCQQSTRYLDGRAFIEKEKNKSRMIHATAFQVKLSHPNYSPQS